MRHLTSFCFAFVIVTGCTADETLDETTVSLTGALPGGVNLPPGVSLRMPLVAGTEAKVTNAYGEGFHVGLDGAGSMNQYYALDLWIPPDGGIGKPALAPAAGTVLLAGWAPGGWASCGQWVVLEHNFGDGHRYITNLCHLNAIRVSIGQHVAAGQQVGDIGCSSDLGLQCLRWGPHLHISMQRDAAVGGGSYGGHAVVPEAMDGYTNFYTGMWVTAKGTGGSGSKLENQGKWLTGWGTADWAALGDFNGDGKDDVAWYEGWNGGSITVARSTGSSLAYAGKWLSGWGRPDWAGVGDFNGDGKDDVAWYESWNGGSLTVALSNGGKLVYSGKWLSGWGKADWAGIGDFNGDGKDDIAWYEGWNGGGVTIARSTGTSFAFGGKWLGGWGKPDWAGVGDFDGDGRADLAWYEGWNNGSVTVARSTGSSFAYAGKWLSGWGKPTYAATGDFNGDGKDDLAWYEAWNGGAITIARSTGSSLQNAGKWLTGFGGPTWAGSGDLDGDGRSDLAWYEAWNNGAITAVVAR